MSFYSPRQHQQPPLRSEYRYRDDFQPSLSDEIQALKEQYLISGGKGQAILDQIRALEEECRSLEITVG
jgi:hypothetical protein